MRLCVGIFLGACLSLMLLACGGKKDTKDPVQSTTIALFTDFGYSSPYLAQLKSSIKSIAPQAEIMDLMHTSPAFDVAQGAYLLDKATRHLPSNIIVVAVVDPGVGTNRNGIALRTKAGGIYIGPDNGLFTRVVQRDGLDTVVKITNSNLFLSRTPSSTFHGRDIFAPVAAHLLRGIEFPQIGPVQESIVRTAIERPSVLDSKITAQVVYIDPYGNIITNVLAENMGKVKLNQLIRVGIAGKIHQMPYVRTYGENAEKRMIALIGSDGELELALPNGNAASTLKVNVGDTLVIYL